MELHKTPERTKSGFVLLDQNMRLVKPVNEYLDFQALRGRAENTLLAYGKDLKTFFEFLEQRKLQYDQVTANMLIEQLVEMEQLKAENKQLKELLSIRKLE